MKTSEIKELSTSDLLERIDTEKTMLVRMKLNHAITLLITSKGKRSETDDCTSATELRIRELIRNQ